MSRWKGGGNRSEVQRQAAKERTPRQSARPKKPTRLDLINAMDLLLTALRCGAAHFDPVTHEFRFMGLRYSTSDHNRDLAAAWVRLRNSCGEDNLSSAIAAKLRGDNT